METTEEQRLKLLEQKKEAWIKNVQRVQGLTHEQATELYDKIKPYVPKNRHED